ncbi:MAG: DUF2182 domain-containing protein [Geminicoccaceae bacterium]
MLAAVLRRERAVVRLALLAVVLASWGWLLAGAGMGLDGLTMTRMSFPGADHAGMETMRRPAWDAAYVALMLAMWWLMMLAMMLPGAAPAILLFDAIGRRTAAGGSTLAFVAGYAVAWAGFSAVAVALQAALQRNGLLTPMLLGHGAWLNGALLVAAGLWQLSPLKAVCLEHCRSPVGFLTRHWRGGAAGALRLGLLHGAWCVACCWALMLLLFVGGVMNLAWIAVLALLVLAEKTLPGGARYARLAGVLCLLAGIAVLAGG